jgi:hypothetical protein
MVLYDAGRPNRVVRHEFGPIFQPIFALWARRAGVWFIRSIFNVPQSCRGVSRMRADLQRQSEIAGHDQ